MINPRYHVYFLILIFWANSGVNMGISDMWAFKGLGPLDPPKNLTHWVYLLGPLFVYIEIKISKFSGLDVPLLCPYPQQFL